MGEATFRLLVVLRRIHGDEHRQGRRVARTFIDNGYAAAPDVRRKHLVIGVHRHDVFKAGYRPIGAIGALGAVVDRILATQALEIGPVGVASPELDVADVDVLERDRLRVVQPHRGGGVIGHGVPPIQDLARLWMALERTPGLPPKG